MAARRGAPRRRYGSDFAKVDAHVIQPEEYEEIPELTDEEFARAEFYIGGKRVGRPPAANPKRLISIRLTEDVIQRWRASGPGWQTRMAEKLTKLAPK